MKEHAKKLPLHPSSDLQDPEMQKEGGLLDRFAASNAPMHNPEDVEAYPSRPAPGQDQHQAIQDAANQRPGLDSHQKIQHAANNLPHIQQHQKLQRAANESSEMEAREELESALNQERSPQFMPPQLPLGPPATPPVNRTGLPDKLLAGLQALTGLDLSAIRVHRNAPEPSALGARALTRGLEIFLAPGEEEALSHEAWHVVQQVQGRVTATTQFGDHPGNADPGLEAEATSMGEKALQVGMHSELQSRGALSVASVSAPVMQRLQIAFPGRTKENFLQVEVYELAEQLEMAAVQDSKYFKDYFPGLEDHLQEKMPDMSQLERKTIQKAMKTYYELEDEDFEMQPVRTDNMKIETAPPPFRRPKFKSGFKVPWAKPKHGNSPLPAESEQLGTKTKGKEKNLTPKKRKGDLDSYEKKVADPILKSRKQLGQEEVHKKQKEKALKEEIFDSTEESQEAAPKGSGIVLGVGSWNVAHFSNKDLNGLIKDVDTKLGKFDPAVWIEFLDDVLKIADTILTDPLTRNFQNPNFFTEIDLFMEGSENELSSSSSEEDEEWVNEETSEEEEAQPMELESRRRSVRNATANPKFQKALSNEERLDNDLFYKDHGKEFDPKGILKGKSGKGSIMTTAIRAAENFRSFEQKIDRENFGADLGKLAQTNWKEEMKAAREDPAKRAEFAEKVKRMKGIGEVDISEAKALLEHAGKILDQKSQKFFEDFIGEDNCNLIRQATKQDSDLRESLVGIELLGNLGKALHSHNVKDLTENMFANNEWLDVMILQEVNDPTLLKKNPQNFDVIQGPKMQSAGENGGQREYYPILLRKESRFEVRGKYMVETDGTLTEFEQTNAEKGGQRKEDADKPWDKGVGDYRPIVVYKLELKEEENEAMAPILIGVVHTTPESDSGLSEFNRMTIFQEIENGLNCLGKYASEKGYGLIVGGDYYLTAEAKVEDRPNLSLSIEEKEDHNEPIDHLLKPINEKIRELEEELEMDSEVEEEGGMKEEIEEGKGMKEEWSSSPDFEEYEKITNQRHLLKELRKRRGWLLEAKKPQQVLRNTDGLTMAAKMEEIGMQLAQSLSGTNPKADPLMNWFDLQIADFFITKGMKTAAVGIMHPDQQMVVVVDREDLAYSRYWQHFSDHFPVAGLFSFKGPDSKIVRQAMQEAFVHSPDAREKAERLNYKRFAFLYLKGVVEELMLGQDSEEQDETDMELAAYIYYLRGIEEALNLEERFAPNSKTIVEDIQLRLQELLPLYQKNKPDTEALAPGYDAYIGAYLGKLKSLQPKNEVTPLLGGKRPTAALLFLQEKLEILAGQAKEDKSEMELGQDSDIWEYLNAIRVLERKILKKKGKDSMEMENELPLEKLWFAEPEDFEPERLRKGGMEGPFGLSQGSSDPKDKEETGPKKDFPKDKDKDPESGGGKKKDREASSEKEAFGGGFGGGFNAKGKKNAMRTEHEMWEGGATELVNAKLQTYGLEIDLTVDNGDCLFDAVRMQLGKLGYQISISDLRGGLGNLIQNNSIELADFMGERNVEEVVQMIAKARSWRNLGGDIAPQLVPTLLGVRVFVMAPEEDSCWEPNLLLDNSGILDFKPDIPIFIAYNGANHYWGTKSLAK